MMETKKGFKLSEDDWLKYKEKMEKNVDPNECAKKKRTNEILPFFLASTHQLLLSIQLVRISANMNDYSSLYCFLHEYISRNRKDYSLR